MRLDPNVLGYGFGDRMTDGAWLQGIFLTIYVREKFCPAEIRERRRFIKTLPRKLGPYLTDVLPIGEMRACLLDHHDTFASTHTRAAAALLVNSPQGPLALLSGHVALPRRPKELVHTWDAGTGDVEVRAHDKGSGDAFTGRLLAGRFGAGRAIDWAVARIDAPAAKLDLRHHGVDRAPPLTTATIQSYTTGTTVRYHSPARGGKRIEATIANRVESLAVRVAEGYPRAHYTDLLLVDTAGDVEFSVRGDSGSLVFDRHDRAIGMVVANSTGTAGAIATLHALVRDPVFAPLAQLFFR